MRSARFHLLRLGLLAFASVAPLAGIANAQPAWPTRPLRIVVPFAPGGATDIITRIVSEDLTRRLGQPIVVENRSGANGTIAGLFVARSAPDGTTFLMGSNGTNVITTFFMKDMPYDPRREFRSVGMVAQYAQALVVISSLPVSNLAQFIAYAKTHDLNYASTGNGARMAMELFMQRAGVSLTRVGYRGSGPALQDLTRGEVQATFDLQSSTLPLVNAGQLRALAVSTPQRNPRTPDVPTMAEAGLPGVEMVSWQAIFAPAGTADEVISTFSSALLTTLRQPEIEERMRDIGAAPFPATPAETDAYIAREFSTLGAVAEAAGIQPE